jgi:dTDP-4-amino-4,6-dideoxygalactose transaminase
MNIPMVDPAGEYRELKAEIDAAVGRVFSSGRFVLGPEGEALEREIAQFIGAAHAVGCNSGTDALHFPLLAAGIGPGDEVVIPGFTFFATGEAVSYTGATPVFADVDPGTFNLDPESFRKSITRKTKAVIAVHLFGQCAALDEIAAICKEKKLVLVEDCAQCIGADYDGRRAGSWGDFGGFSFYPTKNLAAAGDAGLITTQDAKSDAVLRMLRHHGSRQTYLHERVGWNSRLDELQAAVLRVKLKRLEDFNRRRRAVAKRYREKLAGARVTLPVEHGRGTHVYHQFTIRSERRDAIREALGKEGIASSVFYPMPLH